jgi:acyl carrier protein
MSLADRVKAIVVQELDVPESQVTESATFMGDLKADSLMVVELIMSLEEEFGVEIPEEDAQGIQTVGDAIRYLEQKTGGE